MKLNRVTFGGNSWSQDVGDYDTYTVTKYGTYVKETGNSDDKSLQVLYSGDPMSLTYYIGEVAASISPGDNSGSGNGTVSVQAVKDSEVTKFSDKNIIVVGGSCINTVAAQLLGSSTPLCTNDFTAKTSVGAGGYLLQTFASPYNAAKIATLVAGYEAAETVNAADYLLTKNVTTAVGDKYVTGVKQTVTPGTTN